LTLPKLGFTFLNVALGKGIFACPNPTIYKVYPLFTAWGLVTFWPAIPNINCIS